MCIRDRSRPRISVVLPTMNEPHVGEIIERIKNTLRDYPLEIIVVDRSSDMTPDIARQAGARIVFQRGRGYGDAYIQGFREVTGDIVVMLDPDGTYLPEEIPRLLEPILRDEADIVIGNRWANMKPGAMSSVNRFGNRFLTWLLNFLYHMDISDSQSGMRAIRREALDGLQLCHPGMPLASEMIIEARKNNLRICEVPITYEKRLGETKQRIINGFLIAAETLRLLRDYNPLLFFGCASFVFFLISFIFGATSIYTYIATGSLRTPGRAILSAMFFNSGVVLLMFALLLDLQVKLIRNSPPTR